MNRLVRLCTDTSHTHTHTHTHTHNLNRHTLSRSLVDVKSASPEEATPYNGFKLREMLKSEEWQWTSRIQKVSCCGTRQRREVGATERGWGGGRGRICFNYIVNMGNSVTVLAGYQSTELVKIIHDQYQVIWCPPRRSFTDVLYSHLAMFQLSKWHLLGRA